MKKITIAMTLGLMMVLGAAQASAQCPGAGERGFYGHGPHGRMMLTKMKEELNLSNEQIEEFEKLHNEMRAEMEPLREQMKDLRDKMHELWSEDYPSEGALITLEREMSTIQLQLSVLRIQMRLGMMEILTAEQRAKFKEIKGKRGGKHGWHGKGGQGDCPYNKAKK